MTFQVWRLAVLLATAAVAAAVAAEGPRPFMRGTFKINDRGFSYTLTKLPASARVKRSFFGLFNKDNSTENQASTGAEAFNLNDLFAKDDSADDPEQRDIGGILNNVFGGQDLPPEEPEPSFFEKLFGDKSEVPLSSVEARAPAEEEESVLKSTVLPVAAGVVVLVKVLKGIIAAASAV